MRIQIVSIKHWISYSLIICLLSFIYSCQTNRSTNKISSPIANHVKDNSTENIIREVRIKKEFPLDTITAHNSEELIKYIRSNRVINLINDNYQFQSTLVIDSIKNLSIIGMESTRLMIEADNTTVVQIYKSKNIQLAKLEIGNTRTSQYKGKHGKLRIKNSNDIRISKCKILGLGSSGLYTSNTHNLTFSESEIKECTFLIFELAKSSNFEFINSTFQNNHFSVLGAFTDSTNTVTFSNSNFLDNSAIDKGNPAFNFEGNWSNFDEDVLFSNCTFKNNKGFKWYGDKIKLDNCEIDSSDFIGLGNGK